MQLDKGESLVITNAGIGDVTFDSDRGSWNVSRALRDCLSGKHKTYDFDIAETIDASANVTVDERKIDSMVADRTRLSIAPPIIFVIDDRAPDGREIIWLIDGHHRVRALHRLGLTRCVGYVIEDCEPYRILFNGERVAPWCKGVQTT